MVQITFVSHSTSLDNEAGLSSGWNDVGLSPLGIEQARALGARHQGETFAAVFCSDLQRSYRTAELAFGTAFPIIQDRRLRECDYGDLTQHPAAELNLEKPRRIETPFPNGESYRQTAERMADFLRDLAAGYGGKRVMIIGHRATQYGLEHVILGKSLEEIIAAPWQWQPGWSYNLKKASYDHS